LSQGRPEVFNTDQGVQFTAAAWTGRLEAAGVAVSMDGRGRYLDNVFVERLWRAVKEEGLYLWGFECGPALERGAGGVLPVLQRGAFAPSPGLPDAGPGLPAGPESGLRVMSAGEAFFWPRPPSAPVKGGRGQKNALGQGRGIAATWESVVLHFCS